MDTPAFRGLIVAQFLVANWDLKSSNNRVYEVAGAVVRRRGGSSCGTWELRSVRPARTRSSRCSARAASKAPRTTWPGSKRRGFITGVDGRRVEFDYRGLNEELFEIVTPEDVCGRARCWPAWTTGSGGTRSALAAIPLR